LLPAAGLSLLTPPVRRVAGDECPGSEMPRGILFRAFADVPVRFWDRNLWPRSWTWWNARPT